MLKKYNCTLLHFNKMIKLYIESKVSHKKSGEYRLRNSTTKIDFAANAAKFEETALRKTKFSIKDFFSKCDQICKKTVELVTFNEEILNGKTSFFVQC